MKRIAVFPYDNKIQEHIHYFNDIHEDKITAVYSEDGWSSIGRFINVGKEEQIEVKPFSVASSDYDTIYIVNSFADILYDRLAYVIEENLRNGKEICIYRTVSDIEYDNIIDIAKEYKSQLNFIDNRNFFNVYGKQKVGIDTPVICVYELCEGAGALSTIFSLYADFVKQGYKVATLLPCKMEVDIQNTFSVPELLDDNSISNVKKIFTFNNYIRHIELMHKPDIIIIGIPEDIMPIDDNLCGNFGVKAYLISNAINPDFTILSIYHNFYNENLIKEMENLVKYRFQTELDAVSVAETSLDVSALQRVELKYFHTKDDVVLYSDKHFFKGFNRSKISLADFITTSLSQYNDIEIF